MVHGAPARYCGMPPAPTGRSLGRASACRGSVFLLSIVTLVALLVLGSLSVQVAIQSVNRAAMEEESAAAFNLAEAAADTAEAWLRAQTTPPSGTSKITKEMIFGTRNLDTGSYYAEIYPNQQNPSLWMKQYKIVGVGVSRQRGLTKTVTMNVQQQSFALYSYFTDQETSSVTSSTIWFYNRDSLHGPVHTNDSFHISWSTSDTTPIFYDTVSSVGGSVSWSPRAPSNDREWGKVLQAGRDALTLGADRIPLPYSTDTQKCAAWGLSSCFPTADGVYLPNSGGSLSAGIYICGNSAISLSVDANGNQVVTIGMGSQTTTITVDRDANQTTVVGADTTTYAGVPNGVIYSTGSITSLSGTVADNRENGSSILARNDWTIATDVNSNKDITLTGNLKYQTAPDATQPDDALCNLRAPMLGLVARNVIVASSAPSDMTINGVVLAGGENTTSGSFYNADYAGALKGDLHLLGGVIQKKRGPVGTFNQSTGKAVTGYTKDYNYDPRVINHPPPCFPTTGQYDVRSWQYR